MHACRTYSVSALIVAAALVTFDANAQQQPAGSVMTPAGEPARPRDATRNLPSDTGSQVTTPAGAATGAGQPQGTTRQPDVGSPGGLERRARMQERAAGAGSVTRAAADAAGENAPGVRNQRETRARRASKG